MNKQAYMDCLTSACKKLGIKENSYFHTLTAPHIFDQKVQKEFLIKKLQKKKNIIAVYEYHDKGKAKGWHVHYLSEKSTHKSTHSRKIYDLNGLIDYLCKQAYKIQEPIYVQ